ncbi:cell division protein FtsQ/DivIB [Buchananella felis]|uniref:cell division protein FtsQ/DivIB n=1 Tax=Buchananella felis TaxID=3231492 RepID=UPI0035298766
MDQEETRTGQLERPGQAEASADVARRLSRSGQWEETSPGPADLTMRIEERKSARRKQVTRKLALWGVPVVLVGAVVGLGVLSPFYKLRADAVLIDGATPAVEAEVRAAIEPFVGRPLLLLSTGDVEAAVEQLPTVEDARVRKNAPQGIDVAVTTVAPAIAVPLADGTFELFTPAGASLKVAGDAGGLPVVHLADGGERGVQARTGAVVSRALPQNVKEKLAKCEVSAAGQVVLTLNGDATVLWGDQSEPELKGRVLSLLLDTPAKQYDVSNPDRPTTLN